jgi:hypothetical protein
MKKIELLKPIKVVVQTTFPIENMVDVNKKEFKEYLLNEFNLSYTNQANICQSEMVCDYMLIDGKTKEIWLVNKHMANATPYQEEKINLNWMEIEDLNIFIYSNEFIPTEVICNNPKQKTIVRTNRIESWEKDYRKDLVEQQFKRALDPNFGNDWEKINLNQFKSLF